MKTLFLLHKKRHNNLSAIYQKLKISFFIFWATQNRVQHGFPSCHSGGGKPLSEMVRLKTKQNIYFNREQRT